MKVRSSVEPNTFEIQQLSQSESLTSFSVKIRWDVTEETREDIDGEKYKEYVYKEILLGLETDEAITENEAIGYCQSRERELLSRAQRKYSREYEEMKKEKDKETGEVISSRLHNKAKKSEEIGILRNQIVKMVNELGLSTSDEFEKMNQIAIEEIERGKNRKSDL